MSVHPFLAHTLSANECSSPSPAPQYDNFGRRVNTREYRYRKKLEEERHKLIEKAMKIIPSYHPPSDYRRPTKTQEKVYVPVNDYPEINFSMPTNLPSPSLHNLLRSIGSWRSKAILTRSANPLHHTFLRIKTNLSFFFY